MKTNKSLAANQQGLVNNWYKIEALDQMTYVIHEPRYWQKNNQYLIIGTERALLFDSGSGRRGIAKLVEDLTVKPVVLFNSHAHYDHIGNNHEFEHIAMTDLEINKKQTTSDIFVPKWRTRLVPKRYAFRISEWVRPFHDIDLGGRTLKVVPLPGHSADHVGLVDEANGYIFAADALYQGPLSANLPTARVLDYLESARLLQSVFANHKIYGNHYAYTPMEKEQIKDLIAVCEQALHVKRRLGQRLSPFPKFVSGTVTMYASHSSLLTKVLKSEQGPL